jgi:hypothetical protein
MRTQRKGGDSLTRQHQAVGECGHGRRVVDVGEDGHQCGARVRAVGHTRQAHPAAAVPCGAEERGVD